MAGETRPRHTGSLLHEMRAARLQACTARHAFCRAVSPRSGLRPHRDRQHHERSGRNLHLQAAAVKTSPAIVSQKMRNFAVDKPMLSPCSGTERGTTAGLRVLDKPRKKQDDIHLLYPDPSPCDGQHSVHASRRAVLRLPHCGKPLGNEANTDRIAGSDSGPHRLSRLL